MGLGAIIEKLVIKGDSSSAERASKKTQESLTGAMFKSQLAVNAANKALGFLSDSMKSAIADAALYEKTTRARAHALRISGREVEQHARFLEVEAGRLQGVTGASDEVIRRMQAQAIAAGQNTTQIKTLIEASFGLSHAMGVDVNTAFQDLIKSSVGLAGRNLQLIPGVKELTKEQLKSGEAIRIAHERYADMAGLDLEGTAGAVKKLSNAWADFAESLVKAVDSLFNLSGSGGVLDFWSNYFSGAAAVIEERGFLAFAFMDSDEFSEAVGEIEAKRARIVSKERAKAAEVEAKRDASRLAASASGAADKAEGKKPQPGMFGELRGLSKSDALAAWKEEDERDAARQQQQAEIAAANRQTEFDLEQRLLDRKLELQTTHYEMVQSQRERDAAHSAKIMARTSAEHEESLKENLELTAKYGGLLAGTAVGALNKWAEGAEVSGWAIMQSMLRSIGGQMIGEGLMYMYRGVARGFSSYGLDPTATGLIATGTKQMAIGGALFAGSVSIGSLAGKEAGAGGGPGAGRGAPNAQSFTGGGRRDPSDSRGSRDITFIFQGPTTKPEVGAAVKEAIAEAEMRGL